MSIENIQAILGWSAIINIVILTLWLLAIKLAKNWIMQTQVGFLNISTEEFNKANYYLIGFYKIMITLFNIVPFFAIMLI